MWFGLHRARRGALRIGTREAAPAWSWVPTARHASGTPITASFTRSPRSGSGWVGDRRLRRSFLARLATTTWVHLTSRSDQRRDLAVEEPALHQQAAREPVRGEGLCGERAAPAAGQEAGE